MKVQIPQANPFRHIFPVFITLLLFGCSSTRHLENKRNKEVYDALGLNKDKSDNIALYKEAVSWLHTPHVDGGTSRKGTDCSFLVYSIYKTVYNKLLERNSSAMLKKNCERINRNKIREGDLVFFNTGDKSKSTVNHVGIYLKDNRFIHASTSKGVILSNLDENYFLKTWVCGGRVR